MRHASPHAARRFCLSMMRDLRRSAAEAEGLDRRTAAIRNLAVAAVVASRRRQGLCADCPGCADAASAEAAAPRPEAAERAAAGEPPRLQAGGAGPHRRCCETEEAARAAPSPWASPPRMPRLRAAPPVRDVGPFRAARHGS